VLSRSHDSQPSPFKHFAQRPSQLQSFLKVPLSHPSHSRFFPTKSSSSCRALEEEGRPDPMRIPHSTPSYWQVHQGTRWLCAVERQKKNSGVSNGIGTPSQGNWASTSVATRFPSVVYRTTPLASPCGAQRPTVAGAPPTETRIQIHKTLTRRSRKRDELLRRGMSAHGRAHSGRYGAQTWRWMKSLV